MPSFNNHDNDNDNDILYNPNKLVLHIPEVVELDEDIEDLDQMHDEMHAQMYNEMDDDMYYEMHAQMYDEMLAQMHSQFHNS